MADNLEPPRGRYIDRPRPGQGHGKFFSLIQKTREMEFVTLLICDILHPASTEGLTSKNSNRSGTYTNGFPIGPEVQNRFWLNHIS